MSISRSEILDFIRLFSQHHELKVTVSESLNGAAITAVGALLGGLLGGPRGLTVGGAAAAVVAGILGSGKYRSAVKIINEELDEDQQIRLADSVWQVVRRIGGPQVAAYGAAALLGVVLRDTNLEEGVMDTIQTFFSNIDMPLSI